MSALEQVILEKLRHLGVQQQQKVLEFVENLRPDPPAHFDFETWQAKVDAIHEEIFARHGKNYSIDVQALLDEVREDAS